jgi:2-dehydro-3-deoxyphosphooctonate aldolase (KDO 8-P synthase)
MIIIAGPCQHESLKQSLEIAKHCSDICRKYNIDYYFKASFDKANRTSINGKRGLGISRTIDDFKKIKQDLQDIKIVTDIHEQDHISYIKDTVDVIQIPAFLCRQTDLILAACETGKIVNIKKGQFLAPWDISGILSKTASAKEVWITERGTSFGYNNLVVDFTGMQYILDNFNTKLVFDATHSVQRPGGAGDSSSGNRNYVPGLCRAASAIGVSNFFLEVHPDPDNAPSDGPNMLHLDNFESIVQQILQFHYEKL